MKVKFNKMVSLLLSLVMLVSMLTVGAVVFAEEPPEFETEAASESHDTVEEVPGSVTEPEEPAVVVEPETEKPAEVSDAPVAEEPIVIGVTETEAEVEEVEETEAPKRNGPESTSGNWGDYATYTWDSETATLTVTQTMEQRMQWAVSGTDVDGYADVVETLELNNCNVDNFANYGMKYLKFVNSYVEGNAFAGCTNLEEVETSESCTLSRAPFNGCDNLKKFTISGTIVLSYKGIPTTCVFYGPAMYQEEAESKGYEYHVTDEDPCEHGNHDYKPGANYKEPTCTTDGVYHWVCTRCGHEETVVAPALGHSYDENTHECIRCGELDPNYGGSEDPANPFNDVKSGKWYYDAVLWAVENGVTKGTSDTTFSPDVACTRAQIVTFLWRAAGSPNPSISECSFVDVEAGSFYEKAVLWAVEKGITAGTSKNKFSPDMYCNRAQIVTFLWRYEGSKIEGDASVFVDLDPEAYYVKAVAWAVENGVTSGTAHNKFSPGKVCTRAEAVTFIYRDFKNK